MKNLKKILKNIISEIQINKTIGNIDLEFNELHFDSRKASKSDIFFALKGTQTDGHIYIDEVIQKGVAAVVCSELPQNINPNVIYLQVDNVAKALAFFAAEFYENPSKRIRLVGVTGTNGKTTIATLLYNLLKKFGYKSGLISTIKYIVNETESDASHTTPDVLTINKLLSEMLDAGCKYCFMEVSSHALMQERVTGLEFAGAIFTNLTHDHLDYHVDFAQYRDAKKILFDNLKGKAFALVNSDDKNGKFMLQNTKANKYTFGLTSFSNFKAKILEKHFDGTLLEMDSKEVWIQFLGDFNASNFLAVYSAATLLGEVPKDQVLRQISALTPVRGRFETVKLKTGALAIVDYAHTPDALENVLQTIKKLNVKQHEIITVVGAGGNRDKTKRPIMARIAGEYSDKVILTSDNPRFEEPLEILNDMKAGITKKAENKYFIIENRLEAIKKAVEMAKKDDIILVAGKGHETYQEVKGIRHHFDDREILLTINV